VRAENSIAFRNAISLRASGSLHGQVSERHLERDLVIEQHQLTRDPRLLGILDQRLAPLRLLDLAGAQ